MHDKDDLIHDEYDKSEDDNITDFDIHEDYGEKIHEKEESKPTETSQDLTVFNKGIHHEDDSSDDKSVIEIEPPEENGEQEIGRQDKLLTTNVQIEIENPKVEGPITYSTEQQIFKFKVSSGNNQELLGVNTDFSSYELKWTMCHDEGNHITKSCEYIIIYQDELYTPSTFQEIIHIVKEKYKIKIHAHIYLGPDFPYDPGGTMICQRQHMEIHKKYTY